MSKIYRLHTGANDTVQDWTQIDSYLDTTAINQIPDTAGANAKQQITSIPSPFARIDLVKTAFKNVVSGGQPDGITIFHKMVSDALDVGQVFFNSAGLDKVDIIAWNPGLSWIGDTMVVAENSDLDLLLKSDSASHRLYGETLQMFFAQDAAEYNFKNLQQFYLLHYKDGPGRFNIIGGTSPATLFFSTANPLQYVDLKFKHDKLFDETYCPLHERSEDYILFLYTLRIAMPDFGSRFKAVDDYLSMCLQYLPQETRRKVIALDRSNYIQHYASIPLAGDGNHPEIAGFELRGVKTDIEKPLRESDFVIAATQHTHGLLPLVLPAYTFNGALNYVDGKWSAQVKVPFFDPLPPGERKLPGQEIKYPYLTISDFLEPYLIQLPFEPNQDKFFNGNFPKGSNEGYLLPLTQTFFTYFSSSDLMKPMADGRRMFEFEKLPGNAVKARLRVPVKNGRCIDMERIYAMDMSQQHYTEPDPANNRGIIRSQKFSLVIYPFLKRQTDDQANYTVMLLDQDTTHGMASQYTLKYYKDQAPHQEIIPKAQRQKSYKQQHAIDTIYDIVLAEFDFITVQTGKVKGCLIPLFPVKRNNNRQYSFSIDFGTTNTHIEYSVDGGMPQPLDITSEDPQLGMLHNWNNETYSNLTAGKFGKGATLLLENVPKEMMPEQIGGQYKYKFPRRTVVSEPLGIDINRDTYPLADFSIYWQYDIGVKAKQLKAHTNLKWGNFNDNQDMLKRIEGYIGNLIQLLRNKVVLNGGDLSRTKIIWFYPTSMLRGRLQRIEKTWDEQVERYMGKGITITHLPESIAPFYFFRNENGVMAGDVPVINIDIGGGTTDIVVYKNQHVASYTSFKFAGNALFGDAYNKPSATNGFVQFFERNCRDTLNGTMLSQFLATKESVDKSEEFITSVFGLQNHPERGEVSFSFTERLNETEELKIVPLLFISSIFYHIARYQKYRNGDIPRYITFSGTASKMLHILDVSKKLSSITKLTNLIFNEVFSSKHANIELVIAPGPKEVTAKGGLYNPVAPAEDKFILFGCEEALGYKELTYGDAQDETTRNAVIKEVETFIDLFFSWNSKLDFTNEFALNTKRFATFKKILKADLDIFLVEGIHELKGEMNREEDSKMNETLFFMPLKGALNKLAFCIIDNN
jgi:hypothetical protein